MKKMMNKKGFTLVELIIVLAVLAILAAIAIPSASKIIGDANKKADLATFETYKNAVKMHYAANSSYPSDETTAEASISSYTDQGGTNIAVCKVSGYHFYYLYGTVTGYAIGDVVYRNSNPGAAGTTCDPMN
jgi:prepilin-type N-terminal cleavage/methylation domain-containing protein